MKKFYQDQIIEFCHIASGEWREANYRGPLCERHVIVFEGRNWNVADEDIREKEIKK